MMASLEGAVARFSAKNAFYVWSAVCVVACVWNYACAFCEYDLRLSSPHCVVLKGNSASDCTDVGSCLTPAQIQLLSPRWLGDIVALSGPAPVWLALGVWSLKSDDRRPMRALLALSMLLFVALVPATRHMLDWVGWEPSGHVVSRIVRRAADDRSSADIHVLMRSTADVRPTARAPVCHHGVSP